MRKSYSNLTEGEFRFDKLSAHLDAYKSPRIISISEDATRIICRIEYDANSDKLVGFVLPVDDNFLPITESFYAASFEEIEQMFINQHKATYAYIYMAQPMSSSVPPFCLNIIGTNNRFDATAVLSRWKHMISECKLRNIQIIRFSGDGDTRLLKSIHVSSKFYSYSAESIPTKFRNVFHEESMKSVPLKWIKSKWFAIERVTKISPVQDPVHLGVKLKVRLMTHSQILPLGKFSAQSSHLTVLQSSFRKEQHNLRVKDLDHQDRQNFEAVIRLTSENVITLLVKYLKLSLLNV